MSSQSLISIFSTSILILGICISDAYGQPGSTKIVPSDFPEKQGFVNDLEHLFSDAEIRELDSLLFAFEKQTTIEIGIVTLDHNYTDKEHFYGYTLQLAKVWGIGKAEIDNGILVGISKSLRTIRIQNGVGITPMLSDVSTKQIIDTKFIPHFKTGSFFEGTKDGLLAIMESLK